MLEKPHLQKIFLRELSRQNICLRHQVTRRSVFKQGSKFVARQKVSESINAYKLKTKLKMIGPKSQYTTGR